MTREPTISPGSRAEGHVHASQVDVVAADVVSAELVPIFAGTDAGVQRACHRRPTHDPSSTWVQNTTGNSASL